MKSIKRNIYPIIVCLFLCTSGFFTSCDDYLDVDYYMDEVMPLDSVFKRKAYLTQYMNGAAGLLPSEGALWTNAWSPYQGASDENFASWSDDRHRGMRLWLDEVTPFSDFYNGNYADWYKGIRKANLMLERMHECEDLSEMDRRDYIGKCYFLRGYFYYHLLQAYGPVPIVPEKTFTPDEDVETMSVERDTYDNCIEYICKNLEEAVKYLPSSRGSAAEINMPTSGAALAFISRVRLMAASPWYNGNKFYSDWTRTDGQHFISQENDNEKWAKAAFAAREFIYNTGGKYKLHVASREASTPALPANVSELDFPDGAGNIDPLRSYSYVFNGEVSAMNNPELIYTCNFSSDYGDSPAWMATPARLGGGSGLNIVYDAVKPYRMKDGRDINNSSAEYPYPAEDEAHEPIGGNNIIFSGYTLPSSAARMFNHREPRFYVNIGFCESFWPGSSYTGTERDMKNVVITYYSDGNAMPGTMHPDDYNHTGFTCKKYIHPEDHLKGVMRPKVFPVMRYAEILLNYVEALNELETTYTDADGNSVSRDLDEMVKYFNMIRYRGGMPGISKSDPEVQNVESMRELIKRERQIEFFCEGKRYHDLRRWGDAMEAYNKPITGMNVKARSSQRELFYKETVLYSKLTRRTFSHKMYFLPIPRTTLDKNAKLVQNPGW